ncbi:hypothetical protein C1S86_11375 [Vibrio parahaemolyticus]|uniref:hypothetical protein n=1 Tax=Vibrio parahaemolyticus TaxID=670 RepID=UPI00099393EA|nr:hypothetical protein [Vibrio parahaemolyticus]OOQ70159.1 hypothetical protein BSR61_10245 [Vibrio parahaemolyticus]PMT76157.1 hypothetical protein C1S97_14320 [Vibrio parahaemolyticus]PMT81693.1 hypothetical protein C1S86_11375 [Vibrio parahaemolyticus]
MMNSDETTQLFRKSLNFLFVANREGTSLGVVMGVVSHGVIGVLMPTLKTISGLDFGSVKIWHLIALWVVAFNIRPYINRNKTDPKIEAAINQIEDMVAKGQISKAQAELRYNQLSLRVLESVHMKTPQDAPTER